MKFVIASLIASISAQQTPADWSTATPPPNQKTLSAQKIMDQYDLNHDQCLSWFEARGVMQNYFEGQHRNISDKEWTTLETEFNKGAGSLKCMSTRAL